MDAVSSALLEPVTNSLLDLLKKQLDYIHYSRNFDELRECVKQLKLVKEKVDHQCEEAFKNGHEIEGKAREWLGKVGKFETEVEKYWNDDGHKKTRFSNYLFLYFCHRLGRLAKKMAVEGKKITDDCPKSDEIAHRVYVTSNDAILSNNDLMDFGSRKSIMEQIMATLVEDPTVKMIGVYGRSGVGKSTLIKAIAKIARDKKLFNVVAFSEITDNPNLKQVQEDIAYPLGLKLEGEGENVRADHLRRRLKKEKENTLIILDDLWDRLDLNRLGIPLDGDVDDKQGPKGPTKEKSLGDYKGCKILLTSRKQNVLTDKMEVKLTFCVEELDEKDALKLFRKEAGIHGEMSKSKQEIVKKYCSGLPMAIITVGRALRDKSDSEWEKLKNQDLVGDQNPMEISVKMSYDHLENEELKSIFFLCAQMGHQPLIMDLVKYCFGLGILEGVYSLGEARGKISTSIQKLKNSGLVLDGSSSIHFNMHDLVRDAALSIAQKEHNAFTLRNGKLDDWPELERCTSIFICNSVIIDELPEEINCPQLKFFQIDSDDSSLKIPNSFFKGMKKLKVLMLTGIQLSSLPSSIESLSDLRLLCLERCTLDDNLSIIGKLKKLRILSFSGSRIENLPAELKNLDKLQLLDISNCSVVKRIPPQLMSRLTSLEELYVRKCFMEVSEEGERNQSQNTFISELKHLHQLQVVDLSIPCAEFFPKELFFDNLSDYKIEIGNFKTLSAGDFRMPNKYENFKSLALELKDDTDNIHSQTGIKLLFKTVENLLLGELNGVQDVINELNLNGFPHLKHFSIVKNPSIKYIINSKDLFYPQDVFPQLKSLCLYKLKEIEMIYFSSGTEMICFSPFTDCSFTKLKTIKVEKCDQLKNLFSFCMVKLLVSLETIGVSHCGSLEEIIKIPDNSDKIEFLKLKSLSLESLSSFTSFYTIEGSSTDRDEIQITVAENEHSEMAPPLFGELVEIPNLENLNLISMNKIQKIWSDQPPSNFCFQNLIKLDVKGCDNLRYLCSLSVASSLRKLKGLFVSKCKMMEKIFSTEGNSADKVYVFPKLEEIHLNEMDELTDIWQAEVSADSFSSLTSVNIRLCNKLDKIFPSHMEGWFASLNSLKVSDCESVEVIFEIKDSQQVDSSGGIDTNLQVVHVSCLPMLEQVWSRDPGGILNFKKLQSIEMYDCKRLRNVFPASVAKDVPKLEYMSVRGCDGIVEIVACEDGSETNTEQLVFPELTYMALYDLRSIQHFYRGRHPIECPKLKKLSVGKCNKKLKTFGTGERSNEEDEAVMSAEKIFSNLEYLDIDFDEAQKWLLSNTVKHPMHRLKELNLYYVNDGERLCQILYRMPNLEKLFLWEAKHLLKESSESRLGTVLQLKELVLSLSGIKDIGFEREPVLQRLELLSLNGCDKLRNLAPPSVSLAYLTNLKVVHCNGLRNLMASSTAKSLVQLKSMKISRCNKLEEIVSNEGNEEAEQIVFGKLITIELEYLLKLKSFCSYKNYEFKFPSLEVLIVRECPLMQRFTEGGARAPKLQNIVSANEEGKEEAKWQWEGDLNATIQKGFNKLLESASTESSLSLRDSPLQVIWLDSRRIPKSCFSNLNSLTVDGCQFLTDVVIPFYLLPFLTNLEKLKVRNCGSVKSIFDITQEREMTTMGLGAAAFPRPLPFSLKKLTLERLPKLENVWNEDPHGILTMQLLQHVIVAEDNADPREANLELTFPCPCVRSLKLQGLPKFKYFYYCSLQCDMFQTPTKDEMPTSNLQCLSLGEKGLEMIKRGEFQRNFLHKLQVLTLCFHIGSNVFPYEILQLAPNIEKLVVCDGSFKEIFCFDSLNVDEAGLLLQLKVLCLDFLPELVSIGLENSWIQPLLGNLETLEVIGCSSLKDLVPSTVSFSNLIYLKVERCNCLLYLFTSSTARSFGQLKRLEIKRCDSIEEIVFKDGGEPHENEIIFPQLNCLKLERLRKLRRFYRGSLLSFPSLEELSVIYCEWMETLCPGTLKADKLVQLQLKSYSWSHSDAIKLENDLNSTMREAFWEKLWDSARSVPYIDLKDSPLQEIWLRLHSLHIPPHFCFTYLHTFIVDGCHFLSDAVLPFSLLPLLPKLETLEVRNCDFVKIIFDVTTMGPLPFALKTLALCDLPNLENVWNSNVELTFPQVKSLALCDLPKLKYDMLKPFTHLEPHPLNQLCIQKLTPNIEHLTLGVHELNMILSGEFQGNHLNELKVLALFFHFDSDVFVQRVPNIEKLEVCDGSFKEIFCFDSLNVDEDGLVSQLKVICPDSLPELVSIGSENSGIVPFLRNLETLQVISCFSSINLVPCTVSFSNLTYLKVESCKSLLYLFTSSKARSLGQLKTMEISWCDSIEEIVSSTEEGDESDENEIIFQQLNCLKLEYLFKLRRFYKGSLSFPSLEEFTVWRCDRMESLCAGTVKTDKLLQVNTNWGGDVIPLETDLNSAMQNR
ncbi:putative disease resistance protein isoform D [Glycine soja]|uniref:Putative disease resistance protein isoform A n=1 Tax=Glycine soja TaxID=3848 RepID=A0A445JTC0_GLYSO|nr:putative disease resistance protein isoform A [Glycine soja]RZC01720.1 putative disease resistance protein isoform B [Glycine soja]RZC01721.1 putative disease resistance protein isoform C [Glycine soja]RZC01722.1 putative disease resistance protein isoform D [Glycine soja]